MSRAAAAVEAPLAGTLRRLAERSPYLTYGSCAQGGDWVGVERLGDDGAAALAAAVASAEAEGATEPRVRVAWFVHRYSWMLAAPAIGCLYTENRLPWLGTDNTALHVPGDGREWRVGLRDSARLVALRVDPARDAELLLDERAELLAWLRTSLEGHLADVLTHPALARLGPRARWLLAADACVGALLDVGQQLVGLEPAVVTATAFASTPGPLSVPIELVASGDPEAPVTRWRSSCCLAYRVDGLEKCAACPLVRRRRRGER